MTGPPQHSVTTQNKNYNLNYLIHIQSNPDTVPLYIPPPLTLCPQKPQDRNILSNFKGNLLVQHHLHQPPTTNICTNTNVLLIIIITSDIAQYHFASTSYTKNSLEYSVVKILYTNNSVLTNKSYSGKKPPTMTWGGRRVVTWSQQCKWRHSKSRQLLTLPHSIIQLIQLMY
jgi:hypothetical protein